MNEKQIKEAYKLLEKIKQAKGYIENFKRALEGSSENNIDEPNFAIRQSWEDGRFYGAIEGTEETNEIIKIFSNRIERLGERLRELGVEVGGHNE